MEIRQLTIFCDAAQTLNFTKTAHNLNYAQSNITGQIKLLEAELNTKLFERMGKGLILTESGKSFLHNAQEILRLCEQAKYGVQGADCRGIINLGVAETAAVYRMPDILKAYRAKFPAVELRMFTENTEDFYAMLRTGTIDLAIALTSETSAADMFYRHLFDDELILVAAREQGAAAVCSVSGAQISSRTLLMTSAGCGYRPQILKYLQSREINPKNIMEMSSVAAIKELVAADFGVAFLPYSAVAKELSEGRIQAMKYDVPEPIYIKTQLIYHRNKWLSPALKGFLALLEN